MGKKTKIAICLLVIFLISSFVWFNFVFLNINGQRFEEALTSAGKDSDVIIVFNSGGWGTVPFSKAFDFNPIISEAEKIIESRNHKVSVVEYYRTEDSFFAKVASLRDVLFNFPDSSKVFSERIEEFLKANPNDKVILAGLSNGAAFVDASMADLKNEDNSVLAIELGAPFWKKNVKGENILALNNQADILANGELGHLAFDLIRSPFVWAYYNITGNHISMTEALHVEGHDYSWPEVKTQLTEFLDARL